MGLKNLLKSHAISTAYLDEMVLFGAGDMFLFLMIVSLYLLLEIPFAGQMGKAPPLPSQGIETGRVSASKVLAGG